MSAAFSGVFGTPIAAAVFSMEVVSVGSMQYSAIVPCTIASLVSNVVATRLGATGESFHISGIPAFGILTGAKTIVLAILCAGVSVLFCIMLHKAGSIFKLVENQYYRIIIGGSLIVCFTALLGTSDYAGAGMEIIERAISGKTVPYAFAVKMLFTAITLGCGYKGGEIVPSFFIGATFGCLVGYALGLSPSLCASIGMVAVFCGVTNCPISSLLIALELFGISAVKYHLLAIAISYMLSGYYSLYHTQRFIYSKYEPSLINQKAH
jgi:H+/Cl- antiporter ClcA